MKIEIKIEEIEIYPFYSINSSYGKIRIVSKRLIRKFKKNKKKFKKIQEKLEALFYL